ncbi:MAG: hypothetical protein AAF697_04685 [Pseudomonadota bacterium]
MLTRPHRPALRLAPMLALAPLALGACQSAQAPAPQAAASSVVHAEPSAFIEAACGGCHGLGPNVPSPNPAAPSFEHVANTRGLDQETLAAWLSDAHNYPEVMDFDLTPERVDEVAAYMITLKREDYEPTG